MNSMKAYCVILVVSLACLMHSSNSNKHKTLSINGEDCISPFHPTRGSECFCNSSKIGVKPYFQEPNGKKHLSAVVKLTSESFQVPYLVCRDGTETLKFNITFAKFPADTKISTDKKEVDLCKASNVLVKIDCSTDFKEAIPIGGTMVFSGPGVEKLMTDEKYTHNFMASEGGQYAFYCSAVNSLYGSMKVTKKAVVNVYGPPVIKVNGERVLEGMTGTTSQDSYTIGCTVAGGPEKGKDVNLKCGDETRTSTGAHVELVINSTVKFHSGQCTCQGTHPNKCSNSKTSIEVERTTGKGSHGNRIEVNVLEISVGFLTALLMSALQAKRV